MPSKKGKSVAPPAPPPPPQTEYTLPFWPWDEYLGEIKAESVSPEENGEAKETAEEEPKKKAMPYSLRSFLVFYLPQRIDSFGTKAFLLQYRQDGVGVVPRLQPHHRKYTILQICERLFKTFDGHKLKRSFRGKTTFSDIRSFIEEAKLPNLTYEAFVELEPDENGIVLYKSWKGFMLEKMKENPPGENLVPAIDKAVSAAIGRMEKQILETLENKEQQRQARHIQGMSPSQYQDAADMGEVRAQYYLATCYHFGRGTEVDYEEAAKWYNRAALSDHADSCAVLGFLYESGKGVERSLLTSFEFYKKGAELGNSRAARSLSICYEYGRGTEKNVKLAEKWYKKAADNKEMPSHWAAYTLRFFRKRHELDKVEEKKEDGEQKEPLDPALAATAARVEESLKAAAAVGK
eukprot:jgi/Bigna1/126232/aug1.2_g940